MTHHGKFRSDDPCETNWKSSSLLHDSTPYYNDQMNGNDANNDTPTNPSGFSPNYGDDNTHQNQQNWDRSDNNNRSNYNSNYNGFKSGIHKRSDINRNAFPQSFRNRFNYNRRGRGRGGFRPRGRGGYRGRGRGRGGYRRGGRGYPRYRSRGRGRGQFRGGPRRFKNNRKPTIEDLDRDLDKYLYGGDDGEERKKTDLDNDLDSYWNDSNINSVKKVENDESENDKEEVEDAEVEKKEEKEDQVEKEEDVNTNQVKESESSGDNQPNGH
eukprot:152373_1